MKKEEKPYTEKLAKLIYNIIKWVASIWLAGVVFFIILLALSSS